MVQSSTPWSRRPSSHGRTIGAVDVLWGLGGSPMGPRPARKVTAPSGWSVDVLVAFGPVESALSPCRQIQRQMHRDDGRPGTAERGPKAQTLASSRRNGHPRGRADRRNLQASGTRHGRDDPQPSAGPARLAIESTSQKKRVSLTPAKRRLTPIFAYWVAGLRSAFDTVFCRVFWRFRNRQ